ncbi:MAG: WxcM-like domain-containing protein [Rhodospirillaceae bacterium]|nr:WxcM-like domain-containing protein [Rhodospirillaceae bacterium]
MTFKAHPQALVDAGATIGDGTRIWAFAHVLPGARIGKDCNICDGVFIENNVVIGDRVTVKCGVQVWDNVHIEDDVFVGPNATFTNDRFPRSKQYPDEYLRTIVSTGASIGANATILPGLTIGRNAMIGAGAVVIHNVPPNAIVVGNPGVIVGYVSADKARVPTTPLALKDEPVQDLGVSGAKVYRLPLFRDLRGSLAVAEYGKSLPFQPKRCFMVFDVPSREVRGEHAHKTLHQFLICVKGQLSVVVDNGNDRAEVRLDGPGIGLHLPARVWGIQYKFSPDAVLMVLASDGYDENDYIRDYGEYIRSVQQNPP